MTSSKEDYLRVVLELSGKGNKIHSKDIAQELNVSKASVSRMMGFLKNAGYISKEKFGTVTLTERGYIVASLILKKRRLLKDFLTDFLGVEPDIADNDACRMEHAISAETMERLDRKLDKLTACE